jgi:hypothetical protein
LLRLFRLRAGSTIKSTGPRSSASCASSIPPGRPISRSAVRKRDEFSANGGRSSKIRPKRSGRVRSAWASSGRDSTPDPAATTPAAPTPILPRKRRLVNFGEPGAGVGAGIVTSFAAGSFRSTIELV